MKKTTVYELRKNLAWYLNDVARTDNPVVVYKFNKPIAVLMPAKKDFIDEDFTQYFGFLGKGGETGEEYVNRVRRNRREKEYIRTLRSGKT